MRNLPPRIFQINTMLIAGVLVGLVVGLLIGWVIWPVQWQGATLDELFPDYMAAVAESYTMYGSPEAAETARQRLAPLGNDLSEEFKSAIAQFSESNAPNKSVRLSNLNSLAAAIGVSLPGLVGATQIDAPAQEPTTAAPTAAATPVATPESEGGIGWVSWLLGLLAAAALVLGGVYLLMLLSRRHQASSSDAQMGQMIDNQIGALRTGEATTFVASKSATYDTPDAANEDEDEFGPPPTRAPQPAPLSQDEPEEYEFDDDPEDYTGLPAMTAGQRTSNADHYTQYSLEAEPDGESDEELYENKYDGNAWGGAKPASGSSALSQEPPPIRVSNRPAEPTAAVSIPSTAGRNDFTARPTTVTRGASRFKLLEIYTAHYQAAIHDYDESHPITDPVTAKYIGECGMGGNTKNGLLQNNPEQGIAL